MTTQKPKPADAGTPDVADLQAQIATLQEQLAARDAGQMADVAPAPVQLPVPKDLPAGFVFNTITGQQWCGACAVAPPNSSTTSWTCDHGSWQAETQTYTPDAA